MPASWVNTSVYEGDDIDADGRLYGMGGLADAADVQLAKLTSFLSRFPKPNAKQGVRADAMLAALRELMPLANKIAKLKDGENKSSLIQRMIGPAQGYLTGPTVTQADKATAGNIRWWVETGLPSMGPKPLDANQYAMIKEQAHQLLKIGRDLGDDVSLIIDSVWRAFDAYTDAVIDLPVTVINVVGESGRRAVDAGRNAVCSSPAGALLFSCWPTWKKVVVVGAGVTVGSLLLYGVYRIILAATPTATQIVAKRYGLRGVRGARRIPRSRRLPGRRRSR